MDYYTPKNAGYYQNNGSFNDQGDIKSGYNQPRNPQHSENNLERDYRPQYVNNPPPANNNNYDGGGVYPDIRNGYSNNDPYYSTSSAYDSGYSAPHNISSRSNTYNNYGNPYATSFDNTKPSQYSYNTPTPYSPVKYPNSPAMHGMNPPYPPINPIPARQVPYGGRPTDPYSEGASLKEMPSDYYSKPSSNPSPANHGQENPLSPTSAYSNKPFLDSDNDEKRAKPGGLMKYCRCGTCGKTCAIICCIIILLIIGIVAGVLLWARPPKVDFLRIVPSPNGLPAYNARSTGFDFNLGLQIQVDNPNIVGANFEMIKAIAFYPGHSDPIGGGNLTNVKIAAKGNTTIDFPFSVNYNKDIDPGFTILFDIAQKCGLTGGGTKEKLQIDYKLTLTIKVLLITLNPSFDRKAMIDCPIKDGKIPNIPGFDIGKAAKEFGKNGGKKKKRELLTGMSKSPILFK